MTLYSYSGAVYTASCQNWNFVNIINTNVLALHLSPSFAAPPSKPRAHGRTRAPNPPPGFRPGSSPTQVERLFAGSSNHTSNWAVLVCASRYWCAPASPSPAPGRPCCASRPRQRCAPPAVAAAIARSALASRLRRARRCFGRVT